MLCGARVQLERTVQNTGLYDSNAALGNYH